MALGGVILLVELVKLINEILEDGMRKLDNGDDRIIGDEELKGFLAIIKEEEWVKVSDRIPDTNDRVLIHLRSGTITVARLEWEHPTHEDNFKAYWYWDCDEIELTDDEDVTHWKRMPEGPEED